MLPFFLVYPVKFSYPTADVMVVNGSLRDGGCSNVANNGSEDFICLNTTSSVLFDGSIPSLAGLDEDDKWASQLLTVRSNPAKIACNFTGAPGFVGVRRVEIVLFNCPEWGISVQSITLEAGGSVAGTVNLNVSSCDSLVRVCMPDLISTIPDQTELALNFFHVGWSHIAEVTFYGVGPTCPQDQIIISTLLVEATTTTTLLLPSNITSTISVDDNLPIILSAVLLISLFFVSMCMVTAFLLLWRCYCSRRSYSLDYKKNSTTNNPATEGRMLPDIPLSPLYSAVDGNGVPVAIDESLEMKASADPSYSTLEDIVANNDPSYSTLDDALKDNEREYFMIGDAVIDDGMKIDASVNQPPARNSNLNVNTDELYAVVDKKRKGGNAVQPATKAEQLYAQVNKKTAAISQSVTIDNNADENGSEDFTGDSGPMYSVVNKHTPPQVPPQSNLLMEDELTPPQVPPQSNLLMEGEPTPPQVPPQSDLLMDDEPMPPQVLSQSHLLLEDEPMPPQVPPQLDILLEDAPTLP